MSDPGKIRCNEFQIDRFRSHSFGGVSEFFHRYFNAETRWNLVGDPTDIYVDLEATQFGSSSLVKCTLASYGVSRLHEASLQVIVPLAGAVRKEVSGKPTIEIGAGKGASVSRLSERSQLTVNDGTVLILTIGREKLFDCAQYLVPGAFCLDRLTDTPPELSSGDPIVQALTRNMMGTWFEIRSLAELGITGVLIAEHEALLGKLAATALFADVRCALQQPVAAAGSGPARKARDYIAAHSAEPVEIGLIASQLGVSLRALQDSFQRQYGCSPRSFLRSQRLDRCREALLKAPKATITEVALSCGFSDLGSFTARYRQAFGELPSQTLNRARL